MEKLGLLRYTSVMGYASIASAEHQKAECKKYIESGIFAYFHQLQNFSSTALEYAPKQYKELSVQTPHVVASLQHGIQSLKGIQTHVKKNSLAYKKLQSMQQTLEAIKSILKGFKTSGREFYNDDHVSTEFLQLSKVALKLIDEQEKLELQTDVQSHSKKSAQKNAEQIQKCWESVLNTLYVLLQYRLEYSELIPTVIQAQHTAGKMVLQNIQKALQEIDSSSTRSTKSDMRVQIEVAIEELKMQIVREEVLHIEDITEPIKTTEKIAVSLVHITPVDIQDVHKKKKKLFGIFSY